jgi:hypothetical protein
MNDYKSVTDKKWELHLKIGEKKEEYIEEDFKIIGISTMDQYRQDPELFGKFIQGEPATYWSILVFCKDGAEPIYIVSCERNLSGQFIISYDEKGRHNLSEIKDFSITSYEKFREKVLKYVKGITVKKAPSIWQDKGNYKLCKKEYQGNPILIIKDKKNEIYPFAFGAVKAQIILDHIKDIKNFVKEETKKQSKKTKIDEADQACCCNTAG